MSNIKEIEVNGVVYGIESVNDWVISPYEPTEAPLPQIWLKPNRTYRLGDAIPLEIKPGSENTWQGDYTLDESGNLVETTDQTMGPNNHRATVMFDLFKDKLYKMVTSYNSSWSYSYTWYIYFYDKNGQFISRTSATTSSGSHSQGELIMNFEMPEGAYKIRALVPYQDGTSSIICDREVTEISSSMYYGTISWYQLDGDHYVRL